MGEITYVIYLTMLQHFNYLFLRIPYHEVIKIVLRHDGIFMQANSRKARFWESAMSEKRHDNLFIVVFNVDFTKYPTP